MRIALRALLRALLRGLAALPAALLAPAPAAATEDVPFIVTPDHVTLAMLQLARVTRSDFVLDLGSGDGRIVITAARRFGARGLGVEIVPELVAKSRENAAKAGVADRAEFREQDLFRTDLSVASVITMYLLQEVNLQLRPALFALKPGTRIVSHDWDLGEWKPDRTIAIDVPDKQVGREKLSRLHLWTVPAKVEGLWCGSGRLAKHSVRMAQEWQTFTATWSGGPVERPFKGRIEGPKLRGPVQATLAPDDRLRIDAAGGAFARLRGAEFSRAPGAAC